MLGTYPFVLCVMEDFKMMKHISLNVIFGLLFISSSAIAAQNLKYPSDCKNKILETAAQKNGCYIKEGKGHKLVFNSSGVKITEIPNSVKDNNTCRSIIKAINTAC